MTKTASLLSVSIVVLLLAGCSKDDENKQPAAPITNLQVTVTDNAGMPLSGVPVALYSNLTDWEREQNPVQITTTTGNGKALFSYLTDTAFFVTALKGYLSNWEGTTYLHGLQRGATNLIGLELERNQSTLLAARAGKIWNLVIYKENGQDLSASPQAACLMDDTWRFYKGNRTGKFVQYEDSLSCSSGALLQQTGTWQLTSNGQLRIAKEQQPLETYVLEYLSETTIRLNRQGGGGTYSYVWQAN